MTTKITIWDLEQNDILKKFISDSDHYYINRQGFIFDAFNCKYPDINETYKLLGISNEKTLTQKLKDISEAGIIINDYNINDIEDEDDKPYIFMEMEGKDGKKYNVYADITSCELN